MTPRPSVRRKVHCSRTWRNFNNNNVDLTRSPIICCFLVTPAYSGGIALLVLRVAAPIPTAAKLYCHSFVRVFALLSY